MPVVRYVKDFGDSHRSEFKGDCRFRGGTIDSGFRVLDFISSKKAVTVCYLHAVEITNNPRTGAGVFCVGL